MHCHPERTLSVAKGKSKDLQLLLQLPFARITQKPLQACKPLHKINAMPEHSYFTYIMASRSRTLYIGMTSDLEKRVFEHKWREHDGFTERYNCDRLIWFERYQEVTQAIAREKQLKGWRREKKIALIERTNPAWIDLSRDWYDVEPADYNRALDRMNN